MPPDRIAQHLSPNSPPISIDDPPASREPYHLDASEVLHMHPVSSCDKRTCYVPRLQLLLIVWAGRVTIETLPYDVILLIFHFDRVEYLEGFDDIDVDPAWRFSWWHRLVHVCQSWRSIIFESPHFLDLKLYCGPSTPMELIGIWPRLPIIIRNAADEPTSGDYDFDIAIAHHDRVSEIYLLELTSSQLGRLASAMQQRFPELIHLMLDFDGYSDTPAPALPDLFLGGSAPSLLSLTLHSIPFPALPNLLSSATRLVHLTLVGIPHTGYFSPEAIVTCVSLLTYLESLTIDFESSLSSPNRESRRPPPPTRTILPALTRIEFKGASEYFEGLVAWIDIPLLDSIFITFSRNPIYDIPHLAQFMGRTARFQASSEAHVSFDLEGVRVGPLRPSRAFDEKTCLRILGKGLDQQLSSVAQVSRSFFPSVSTIENLCIHGPRYLQWEDVENMQWLEIFEPFVAVKNLYVSKIFVECIALALQDLVRERVTDVLPVLKSLLLEGPQPSGSVQDAIGMFAAARQLIGQPVAVSYLHGTDAYPQRI